MNSADISTITEGLDLAAPVKCTTTTAARVRECERKSASVFIYSFRKQRVLSETKLILKKTTVNKEEFNYLN